MPKAQPSGNLNHTLKIIAKYEELLHANLIALDIENHTLLVNPEIIPQSETARSKWIEEASLYFAFKGAGDFNHEKDELFFKDKSTLRPIPRLTSTTPLQDRKSN